MGDYKILKLKDAESFTSTKLDGAVKLRFGESGFATMKPEIVPEFFKSCCERYKSKPALAFKTSENSNESWTKLTYEEYAIKVEQVALMLMKIGLEHRDAVGILANNCPEWFYTHYGVIQAGGIVFGMYPTSSPEAVLHMLKITETSICIVDSPDQMAKVLKVCKSLPKLKAIVQLNGPYEKCSTIHGPVLYRWSDLMSDNYSETLQTELRSRERSIYPNECAILVFTSGSTGPPKAVLLSHDNIIFNLISFSTHLPNLAWGKGRLVSYLPMSHVAAHSFEIMSSLHTGACVYFADKDVLRGTLIKTLLEVKPTKFIGVPRIYEKLTEYLKDKLSKNSIDNAHDAIFLSEKQSKVPIESRNCLAENCRKIIGMEHCSYFFGGGAPFSKDLKNLLQDFGMNLMDIYGLTEVAGGGVMNTSFQAENGIGKPIEGTEVKILKTNQSDQRGEILIRGRHVFMGYLNQPRHTEAAIDEDGWFHSGDLGYFNEENCLINIGRIKEIIVTSGGENIAPIPIEEGLKKELPALSNAMVIGDQRKYLTVLLTIKTNMCQKTGLPTDELHRDAITWLNSLNLSFKSLSLMLATLKDPTEPKTSMKIMKSITDAIERINEHALSRAQRVQKFQLLSQDFSVATGELGPSLKICRNVVLANYAKKIDEMYQ